MCWYAHEEPYVPHDTMIERMIVSTFNASNVHEIVHNNTTRYKNMVMDAMRMNQNHAGQFPIVDEEPNADVTRFFNLLKDFDKPLCDGCKNHNKLLVVAHGFTIKSDHGLSEAGYDRIVK
jgi:hypothetical protein